MTRQEDQEMADCSFQDAGLLSSALAVQSQIRTWLELDTHSPSYQKTGQWYQAQSN